MRRLVPRNTKRRLDRRTLTVCVVDPKADDYEGWELLAQDKGVKLRIVGSAEEALRLVRTAVVDLWVVNTELPGLSCYELCSMLKERSANTAVYLVADEYSPEAERAAWTARATLFAVKPMQTAGVQQWLAHYRSSPCATRASLRS